MITSETDGLAECHVGQDRRQGHHRGPVLGDPVGWTALDDPVMAVVGQRQPSRELSVEVGHRSEGPAR